MLGNVYLLHLEPGFAITGGRVARRYRGWTESDVDVRVALDLAVSGSPLVRAAGAAGYKVPVGRTWPSVDRHFERRLKNRHEAPRMCQRCVAAGATGGGRGLLAPAGAPT
jgi:hypothetical protein